MHRLICPHLVVRFLHAMHHLVDHCDHLVHPDLPHLALVAVSTLLHSRSH